MSAVENFPVLLNDAEEESSAVPPCFSSEGINVRSSLHHLPHNHRLEDLPNTCPVPLHPPQQPLPPRSHKTQYQRRGNPPLPP